MIKEDNYLKYDYEGHFYYLTEAGATELADIEPNIWSDPQKRLKRMGRMLHRKMVHSAYNGKRPRYRHQDIIEYRVFKNFSGQREAVQTALVIFAELAEYDELDLEINSGDKQWAKSILKPLSDANIYFRGEILSPVPEEEYALKGDKENGY